MGGLRYVVGDPSTAPSRVGISIGDTLAATFATLGALIGTARSRPHRHAARSSTAAIYEAVLAYMESLDPRVRPGRLHPRAHRRDPAQCRAPATSIPPRTADGAHRRQQGHRVQPPGRRRWADPNWPRTSATQPTGPAGSTRRSSTRLIAEWTATLDQRRPLDDLMPSTACPPVGSTARPRCSTDPHFEARDAIVKPEHPDARRVPHAERGAQAQSTRPARSSGWARSWASTTTRSSVDCWACPTNGSPSCATPASYDPTLAPDAPGPMNRTAA